ncbi:polysaccharide deacetylase family protein [Desulfosporosinus sp. Sb-LF]|uniref:polysaccharide deacetylase family protein n=1 Tax=Desulfosporosinus sp. Sb-LF TaxID=2560027 RepID=UPI00107F3752|nr:polysaccharide deacetylase family protein [Desulfosporosinus sp. Sb-LF]TGE34159.1 polysaccharide deacetylase family protein [Desulfosporosinus sp. Sb-LF]
MLKKIVSLLIICLLIMGASGCTGTKSPEKVPEDSLPSMSSHLISENQFAATNSADETNRVSANNTPGTSNVSRAQAVPVLYYHSVMQETGNEVRMPPDQFDAQMAYLLAQGYQCITLDQLYQTSAQEDILPAKPFVITFDDGYLDNYTIAYPILKKYGFTATIFMVSSYINGEGFMSWSQLRELDSNGWKIEGHTVNHPYLSKLDAVTMLNELKSSKDFLEKGLGHTVNFFAYPYGDVNDRVALAVKNSGYVMAFTTERGWADPRANAWHLQRVYCFASMGLNEFSRRIQNSNY